MCPGSSAVPIKAHPLCRFLTKDGCRVYPERPTACRYCALGTVSMRNVGTSSEEDFYFMVKEDQWLGHPEPKV